jgi:hypothetical protein
MFFVQHWLIMKNPSRKSRRTWQMAKLSWFRSAGNARVGVCRRWRSTVPLSEWGLLGSILGKAGNGLTRQVLLCGYSLRGSWSQLGHKVLKVVIYAS